jgi:hypothetical protein
VELFSRSSEREQELVKMSRAMSELFYGRPVDSFYPGSASHYYPQTLIPHGTTRPLLPVWKSSDDCIHVQALSFL